MRVGVSGGRNYDRWQVVHAVLGKFHHRYGIHSLIQGEADGADFCAKTWAYNNKVRVESYPARWNDVDRPGAVVKYNSFGKPYDAMAGFIRNREMAQSKPDLFLIFPGGSGTKDMRDVAVACEIPTLVVPDREWERANTDDVIITFDEEGEERRPHQKPYWAFAPKPSQRWEVIDHAALAAKRQHAEQAAEHYAEGAMF